MSIPLELAQLDLAIAKLEAHEHARVHKPRSIEFRERGPLRVALANALDVCVRDHCERYGTTAMLSLARIIRNAVAHAQGHPRSTTAATAMVPMREAIEKVSRAAGASPMLKLAQIVENDANPRAPESFAARTAKLADAVGKFPGSIDMMRGHLGLAPLGAAVEHMHNAHRLLLDLRMRFACRSKFKTSWSPVTALARVDERQRLRWYITELRLVLNRPGPRNVVNATPSAAWFGSVVCPDCAGNGKQIDLGRPTLPFECLRCKGGGRI